jgi:RNA polymerase primary sigma factor
VLILRFHYNSLSLYFKDISKYSLLTAEEERELGRRIKEENDTVAREKLINHNLRLVVMAAKKYRNINVSFEDLIAFGNLGLIAAADRFDYTKGFRFSTCAMFWIKQAIAKGIADTSRTIRIPAHVIQLFNKEKKAYVKLYEQGVVNPTAEQVADTMGVEMKVYNDMQTWKKNTISIDTPLNSDDEDSDTLADLCPDNSSKTLEDRVQESAKHTLVNKILDSLDERTKTIFKLRFGIAEPGDPEEFKKEHTLDQIGNLLTPSITRERVRQIISSTCAKLRINFANEDRC